ncbi:MAG: response regulator [Pyrinomonadaceae bacterium]
MSAPAVARIPVKVEPDFQLDREDLVRILVVDDDDDIRTGWETEFKENGYDTDTADGPDAAIRKLTDNSYELVISDIVFDKTTVTGDQMIIENQELLTTSEVVAVSAHNRDRILRHKELERMGIQILQKGNVIERLLEIANDVLNKRRLELSSIAKESVDEAVANQRRSLPKHDSTASASRNEIGSNLLSDLEATLVDSLRTRQYPDLKTIVYGNRMFSSNEIAEEVLKGTEIGRHHMEAMVELFKETLNIRS